MTARRTVLALAAAVPVLGGCKLVSEVRDARHQRQLQTDWPWLGRYAADNAALAKSGVATDIVFMGDSITEGWESKRPDYFRPGRVCRGIGGQTTPQMVLRMMADVIAHRPKFVHIMGGINDIAGGTGPTTLAQTQDNLAMMTMLARAAGIGVLLGSVPPTAGIPWKPDIATVEPVRTLNRWLRDYAVGQGATYVDYTPVLATPDGAMRPDYTNDGLHPQAPGYAAMETVLTPVLRARGLPV